MIKFIKLFICLFGSYLIGSLSPSALLGKIKNVNLRNTGTGNLGATNVMLSFGKLHGLAVMLLDMGKAFTTVKLTQLFCAEIKFAAIAAGSFAVLGHIFPFYMKFKGGKGLAPYAGMILALDPWLFLTLLIISTVAMVTANHSVAMPFSAGILFPLLSIQRGHDLVYVIIAFCVSSLIIFKHFGNFIKAVKGEDVKIRDFIRNLRKS